MLLDVCIVHGMDSTGSTVVLLLSVCTGCTGTVLAVSVYYYSSKNVYSTGVHFIFYKKNYGSAVNMIL